MMLVMEIRILHTRFYTNTCDGRRGIRSVQGQGVTLKVEECDEGCNLISSLRSIRTAERRCWIDTIMDGINDRKDGMDHAS